VFWHQQFTDPVGAAGASVRLMQPDFYLCCLHPSGLWMLSFSRRAFSTAKSFRVLGIQQIAVGSTSKQKLSNLWVTLLGAKKVGQFRSDKENVDEDILQLGRGLGVVEVDIMEPIDPDKSPKVNVPQLNHVGLWVDDLPLAYQQLQEKGVKFTPGGIRRGGAGLDICFIHPKPKEGLGGEGVLIELVQAPAEVIQAYDAAK
jgi:lactoylglutathione lyase